MSDSKFFRPWEGGGRKGLFYWCEGCSETHSVVIARDEHAGPGPCWGFNGDYDKPTFTPSVLVRSGHYMPGQEGKNCWCTYEARTGRKLPAGVGCGICHTFITDGMVQFLGDCTHHLAGQTRPMVPLPDNQRA